MKPETEKLLEEMVAATHGLIGPEGNIRAALRVFVERTGGREFWEIAMEETSDEGHINLPYAIATLLELTEDTP